MRLGKWWFGCGMAGIVCGVGGCSWLGGGGPEQITPEAFSTPANHHVIPESPLSRADQPGQLPANPQRPASLPPPPAPAQQPTVSEVVRQTVRAPGQSEPATGPSEAIGPTTAPTTAEAEASAGSSLSSGQYMTLGAVVAEVNGTPIFANRVIQLLTTELRAQAKKYSSADQFERVARQLIDRQVQELVYNELEVAAAERNLDAADKSLADALTTKERQDLITKAGGSLELARRKAAADGQDFDQMMEDKRRTWLIRVYYEKKIKPLVQVTAADMRQYYEANLDTLFSEHTVAKFRLLEIDPKLVEQDPSKARDIALERIKTAHDKAAAGDDFAALAHDTRYDTSKYLQSVGGDVGAVERHAFGIPKVEDVAWSLQPGQVSDPFEVNGKFYLVKLDSKTSGQVKPFEDEEVQDRINHDLTTEQLRKLREDQQKKLIEGAIIRAEPQMMDPAVEMAMQNYPRWRGSK